ncbi:MAG: DUF917 family protein, partial [Bacteroidota bacterium]
TTTVTTENQPPTHSPLQHYTPTVNSAGEWVLSAFDVECLAVGAGVLGCGGGGSPYLGKLELLHCLQEGFQPKIVSPKRFIVTFCFYFQFGLFQKRSVFYPLISEKSPF